MGIQVEQKMALFMIPTISTDSLAKAKNQERHDSIRFSQHAAATINLSKKWHPESASKYNLHSHFWPLRRPSPPGTPNTFYDISRLLAFRAPVSGETLLLGTSQVCLACVSYSVLCLTKVPKPGKVLPLNWKAG